MALGHGALGSAWELAALAWLALLGVPLAVIDVRSRRLPDKLTVPAFAGVIALLGAGASPVTGTRISARRSAARPRWRAFTWR